MSTVRLHDAEVSVIDQMVDNWNPADATRIRGGRTLYGLALGILMLDTKFPRLPGDIGNAATWPFPVAYRIVRGAFPERMARPDADPDLLEPFVAAARELQELGVPAITT